MKPIRLTRHARHRMRWRQVTLEEVDKVLRGPERVETTRFGRLSAHAGVAGRMLKVTYVEEPEALVVISVVVKA